ncbi:U1 small nuclear ribonucleoprotein 70 kDa-like [Impatiens glandulifera]|uniref:U1 small nuclear ribonucleoprotein 70 kDa-like n=1 Tax=Impatiens glandulifera TaxID=253017 RepID=UPI001FB0D6BF|nr:U1 small nuclear ribonucleoprotein 70 kDa-like [Impatiens glandulifera]
MDSVLRRASRYAKGFSFCEELLVSRRASLYAIIEYVHTRDIKAAYKQADGTKIDNRRVPVDVERGRIVPNWKLRRLGGSLGTTRIGDEDRKECNDGWKIPVKKGRDREGDREKSRERSYEKPKDRDEPEDEVEGLYEHECRRRHHRHYEEDYEKSDNHNHGRGGARYEQLEQIDEDKEKIR